MISRPTRTQTEDKDFELTPAGEHLCTLKLKDCEVPKWGTKEGQRVMLPQKRPGVRFVFKVKDRDWYITTSVAHSTHEKSALFRMMQDCSDSLLRSIKFNKKGFAENDDMFFDILEDLENYEYKVTCEHHIVKDVTWCRYVSCKPVGELDKELEPGQTDVKSEDVSFEDDSIPF